MNMKVIDLIKGDKPKYTLQEICSQFNVYTNINNYGNGHINDTYLNETDPGFILQRINYDIFKNP